MNSPLRTPILTLNSYRHADNAARMNTTKHQAAVVLGSSKSAAKTAAAQANGKQGGRPAGS